MHRDYANNFISEKSSTKRMHAPGGSSSLGSLLGFGGSGAVSYQNRNRQQQQQHKSSVQPANDSGSIRRITNTNNNNTNRNNNAGQCISATDSNFHPHEREPHHQQHQQQRLSTTTSATNRNQSDAEKVRQFTVEAGQSVPDRPNLMALDEVRFISKMIVDELLELLATVLPPASAKQMLHDIVTNAKEVPRVNCAPSQMHCLIGEQADAFVDMWYYSLNAMAKKGVNLSRIFDLVHEANMAKRDPQSGKFLKRADGKIIKPKGWRAPNVGQEILSQMKNGAWE